jgi:hypothetical protein
VREPERGDVVCVSWVDIYEDATGNPDAAKLARRTSYGIFWDRRQEDGIPTIITTTTLDSDGPQQQGFCVYPAACVVSIKVIKRARRARKPVHQMPRPRSKGPSEPVPVP